MIHELSDVNKTYIDISNGQKFELDGLDIIESFSVTQPKFQLLAIIFIWVEIMICVPDRTAPTPDPFMFILEEITLE